MVSETPSARLTAIVNLKCLYLYQEHMTSFFYGHVALKASCPKSCCPKSGVISPSFFFFLVTSKNIEMTYPALFNAWSGVALNRRKFPIKRRRLNNVWHEKEEGKKIPKKWNIILIRHDRLKWIKFKPILIKMSWIKNWPEFCYFKSYLLVCTENILPCFIYYIL